VGGGVGACGVVVALVDSVGSLVAAVVGASVDSMIGSLVDAVVGAMAVGAFVGGGTSTHS
jgi:hypothetical protein